MRGRGLIGEGTARWRVAPSGPSPRLPCNVIERSAFSSTVQGIRRNGQAGERFRRRGREFRPKYSLRRRKQRKRP